MKIGFTGTRQGMTESQRNTLKAILTKQLTLHPNEVREFHHGDCVGADAEAHDIAFNLGYWIVTHPPDNPVARAYKIGHCERKPKPYLIRNHNIVDECSLIIATPSGPEKMRSGTWATVRYTRKVGKPLTIINSWQV